MDLIESSFDLMSNSLFKIAPRADWMMPTPFVLNDAVLIQQKIKRNAGVLKPITPVPVKDSLNIKKDSLKTVIKAN